VYLSGSLTLQPGDVLLTGTPAGAGMPQGEFLQPGDTVKIEVGGNCGSLKNWPYGQFYRHSELM
jgi:2-keto-4-pentenoate hydratase/2-oxohepta-3-ene-1,7-dioic acid hydratase in catechol pathway